MRRKAPWAFGWAASALLIGTTPWQAHADPAPAPAGATAPSYADLVDLAESASLIVKAEVRKTAVVDAARAPGLRQGWVRLYVEAQPLAALAGAIPAAPLIHYLADTPLDARGKPPALKKTVVLLFARPVSQAGDEIQLVAPDGELPWSADIETRTRDVLAQLAAPGAPGRIVRVRELSYVPGALVGEGETQIFLATANGEPASISVDHEPGAPVRWSVSFSELTSTSDRPPARNTLAWYRLACSLPDAPPADANISDTDADKQQAITDYAIVKATLGPCSRTRL